MRIERIILVAFLGNYLINNLVTATVSILGFTGGTMMQYVIYIVLASVATALFTWWYLRPLPKANAIMDGVIFGASAFLVAIVTAIVSGIASVLAQTGSFTQLATVIPNFGPFLMNWATLAILGYWVIPAAFIGWVMRRSPALSSPSSMMRTTPVTPSMPHMMNNMSTAVPVHHAGETQHSNL